MVDGQNKAHQEEEMTLTFGENQLRAPHFCELANRGFAESPKVVFPHDTVFVGVIRMVRVFWIGAVGNL